MHGTGRATGWAMRKCLPPDRRQTGRHQTRQGRHLARLHRGIVGRRTAAKVAEIVRQTEVPNGTPVHAYLVGAGSPFSPDCIRFRRNAYGGEKWRDGRAGDRCGGRGAGDPAGLI